MDGFEQVFVSYHQFQVGTGDGAGDLDLYTVGDDLLQVVGESLLTVLTGPHTGWVGVRVATLSEPPDDDVESWWAASEATLWCPDGRMAVCGLMGDCPDAFRDIPARQPGLVRVRVSARNRWPEGAELPPDQPEQYEVQVWPVSEDAGLRTLRTDDLPSVEWTPKTADAAGWAMVRLVARANPNPREARLREVAGQPVRPDRRADVRRARILPAAQAEALVNRPADFFGATPDGDRLVIPVGEVEVRLSPADAADSFVAEWRWSAPPGSTTAVPDPTPSVVELRLDTGTGELTVSHRGVRGEDAVLLGLLWDYLMDRAQLLVEGAAVPPHPWYVRFDDIAARAAQETAAARDSRDRREALRWGGQLPSERLRTLPANTWGLAQLDRSLLEALAEATPEQQRDVARWAARRACVVAGLAGVDWIADGLAAVERGAPLPPPFDDDVQTWQRLWSDERVPHTVVTIPTGTPNCSQQAIALPAIVAATWGDPLAAAVDALHAAAYAYGGDHPHLLSAARAAFPFLSR